MPLYFAAGPDNGVDLVRAGLARLAARGNEAPPQVRNIDPRSLQIRPPHAVFDLYADEIVQRGGLETAHGGATRYLVDAPSGVLAAAEVHLDAQGAGRLTNINIGPFVAASARGLERLALLDSVQTASFEARLLRCAALYVVAIWLKPDSGEIDIIYPLAPAPHFLRAETIYTAREFMALIRPAAQVCIAHAGLGTVP